MIVSRMGWLRYGCEMNPLKFLLTLLSIAVICIACGRLQKHDVDTVLISEMEKNCKKVEIKKDYDQALFVLAYTGKVSKAGCPLALIRGWKDGKIIEERQVEICGCKDK